jgi:hypothetical protein
MNQVQIERTLNLHKMAYGLLIWLKERAKHSRSLLGSEAVQAMSSANSCERWLVRLLPMAPSHLRPGANDLSAFSHLFSSFFNTSFRIEQVRRWKTAKTKLVTGAKKFRNRRHRRHSERREEEDATELKRLALGTLAVEVGLPNNERLMQRAVISQDIADDLALWTYVRELVRRAEFASQGPSVHRLWRGMGERVRLNLSAETVWQARDNLVRWLSKETGTTSGKEANIRAGTMKEPRI